MKVLVIGSGGREHALAWKLAGDSSRPAIYCAPGNAGTEALGTNLPIGAEDIEGLLKWAKQNRPDLAVVGPEAPLCAGITDLLEAEGLSAFGPSGAAAAIEGSKLFAKEIMQAGGVPTAEARSFENAAKAREYVLEHGAPVVIKADGLAAGKGVYVCESTEDALSAVDDILGKKIFGEAGSRLIVEDCLEGEEASILALVDGSNIVMLASSQDHKRVFNGDRGPNTGGMGAYSPAPVITDELWPVIRKEVFEKTLAELNRRGIIYRGVLYAGLMVTPDGPQVLEFNCRFGDPETQAVIPRMEGDLLPALQACVNGTLSEEMIKWRRESCVCVVMASGGYPGSYGKGKPIFGLDDVQNDKDAMVFHAGTVSIDGNICTSGGRVLGVTALGKDLPIAIKKAYTVITRLEFDQAQYRTDIGQKALQRV